MVLAQVAVDPAMRVDNAVDRRVPLTPNTRVVCGHGHPRIIAVCLRGAN
jgi:hypothetical protein